MTSQDVANNPDKAVQACQSLDADSQLAVLWYLYKDMKEQLNPGTGDESGFSISESYYNEIKEMSEEDQLRVQREIASGSNSTYGSYSSSAKMFLWLRLAQGMENGEIVNVPSDFEMSDDAKKVLESLKSMDLEKQTTFFRSISQAMG